MNALNFLYFLLLLVQFGLCKIRDVRDLIIKLDYYKNLLAATMQDIDNLDTNNKLDIEALQLASEMFVNDAVISLEYSKRATVNNIQNSEFGKDLQKIQDLGITYIQWLRTNLKKEHPNLRENFKTAVLKYENIRPILPKVMDNLGKSSKNREVATNFLMDAIDHSLYLFSKIQVELECRKSNTTEMYIKLQVVLLEALTTLDQMSDDTYRTNELLIHLNQLKNLLHIQLDKAKLSSHRNSFQTTTTTLEKIEHEIESKIHANISFLSLKTLYKSFLTEIFHSVEYLKENGHDQMRNLDWRTLMIDILGLISFYRNEFVILEKMK